MNQSDDALTRESGVNLGHMFARGGLIAGPALAGLLLLIGPPEGLSLTGWRTIALLALMVVWWITEAIPVAATALAPLLVLPLIGAAKASEASAPYADPIIFLFIGGFILAMAVEKWNLHARFALGIARRAGGKPVAMIGGFILAAGLMSMWISNTATALILSPIAVAAARALSGGDEADALLAGSLALGVAYAASIGGIGTPVGSPTNLVAMGYLDRHGLTLSFTQWMTIAAPLMAVMLAVCFITLAFPFFGKRSTHTQEARAAIDSAYSALGPMSKGELRVLIVFAAVALTWMAREALTQLPGLDGLNDTGIAIAGVLALFLIPSGHAKGEALLDWKTAERIPWGIALLFGGGLSMAEAMETNGVTDWLGAHLAWLGVYAPFVIIAAVTALTVFASEAASNAATLTAFLPVVGGVAAATGMDPLMLTFPACMGASLAFMMPIGTPPNAIAYATGYPSMGRMLRLGFVLNIAAIACITIATVTLGPIALAR